MNGPTMLDEFGLRDAIDRTEAVIEKHRDDSDSPEVTNAEVLESVADAFPPEE